MCYATLPCKYFQDLGFKILGLPRFKIFIAQLTLYMLLCLQCTVSLLCSNGLQSVCISMINTDQLTMILLILYNKIFRILLPTTFIRSFLFLKSIPATNQYVFLMHLILVSNECSLKSTIVSNTAQFFQLFQETIKLNV